MNQTINQNLTELQNSIVTVKTTIAENLTNKGVATESSVALSQMVENVNSITGGGGGGSNLFAELGYESTPEPLNTELKISKNIYDNWDATQTDLSQKFKNNTVSIMPLIDTSKATKIFYMFQDCKNLELMPLLDFSNVRDARYAFSGCSKLKTVPAFNFKYVDNFTAMFENCTSLTGIPKDFNMTNAENLFIMFYNCSSLKQPPIINFPPKVKMINGIYNGCTGLSVIPPLDTSHIESMDLAFGRCTNLRKVEGLDFSNIKSVGQIFGTSKGEPLPNLSYILIKNLGKSTCNVYNFYDDGCKFWGDDTKEEGSKQSLIDSLLTYSFDRKSAGMEVAKIYLRAEVKARLTAEEITQIEAKGYKVS